MQRLDPAPDNPPNLGYIHRQLEEALAAARTLAELHAEPSAFAPLCQSLLHALMEIAREMGRMTDARG